MQSRKAYASFFIFVPSVCPSAWNNYASIGGIFVKLLLEAVDHIKV